MRDGDDEFQILGTILVSNLIAMMQVSKLRFSNDPLELLPEHRNQAKREAEGHLKMVFDDNCKALLPGVFLEHSVWQENGRLQRNRENFEVGS